MNQTTSTVLITGASSGIGAAFAQVLAARDKTAVRLILVARRADRLDALAAELRAAHGTECVVIVADLGVNGGAATLFAETEKRGLAVDLLINNAGFGKSSRFEAQPPGTYAQMIQLNVTSLVELCQLYLPAMRIRHHGGIINVASVVAFPPLPGYAVYAATKAAVLSFSQAIGIEAARDHVKVCAVCPGATVSEFQAVAGSDGSQASQVGYQSAAAVANEGLRGYEAGKAIVVTGLQNKALVWIESMLPRSLVRALVSRVSPTE